MTPCTMQDTVSSTDAMRIGSALKRFEHAFAMGPAMTIATVLFAVKQLTSATRTPMPNSQERGPRTSFAIFSVSQRMPPFAWMVLKRPPARIATISVSLMPSVPLPSRSSAPNVSNRPSATPIAAASTVPAKRSSITLSPTSARTRMRT